MEHYEDDGLDYEVDCMSQIYDRYDTHIILQQNNQWHIILNIMKKKF